MGVEEVDRRESRNVSFVRAVVVRVGKEELLLIVNEGSCFDPRTVEELGPQRGLGVRGGGGEDGRAGPDAQSGFAREDDVDVIREFRCTEFCISSAFIVFQAPEAASLPKCSPALLGPVNH